MSLDDDRLARVALSRLAEPGDVRMTGLVSELGALRVYRLLADESGADRLKDDVAARLTAVDPVRELDQAARLGLRFVTPADEEWPAQLADLARAAPLHERGGVPVGLWVKGDLRLDALTTSVAIVGARDSTTYGGSVASMLGGELTRAGFTIVSGAAFGIDFSAHRGALSAGGPTVAVLACGADRVYPESHRGLLGDILATGGAIVSEAPPGAAPQRIRFLARNRLIAALSTGTVVVEAARRSGALNTANWASRLNRVLAGVPGPITSAASEGVHEQMRQERMALVTGAADVLELVSPAGENVTEPRASPDTVRDRLSARQRQVLDAVPVAEGAPADSIARVAGLGLVEVRAALGRLSGAGLVALDDGGWRLTALARA